MESAHQKPEHTKRNYTISEISRLFGIGIDSLRYYERLGVVSPQRGSNGYRLYDLDDMYKLSLIKDLRRLDLPMKQIKDYLDRQTVASTRELLDRERCMLEERIAQLQNDLKTVQEHAHELDDAQNRPVDAIEMVSRANRHCVQLSARIERDAEMDLLIQRLHRQYEHILPHLGMLEIGGALSVEDLDAGRANVYHSVFFVLEGLEDDEDAPCDFMLEGGTYLVMRYRGPYEQNGAIYEQLLSYAALHCLEIAGPPYEFYEIDNRDTADPTEFLSRIEMRVDGPAAGHSPSVNAT